MVLLDWLKARWLRVLVHAAALAPLVWTIWQYWQGLFLVDPVREITTRTGRTALILLVLSLACTPLGTVLGLKRVLRVRRALGMYAFLYASLHFATFVGLDYGFDVGLLGQAVFDQPYVLVGLAAGLILLALALTSTQGWQRRLGKNWKRLHRLVYVAVLLAVVHMTWILKDPGDPLRYLVVLALLFVLRLPPVRRGVSRVRYWFKTKISAAQHASS
ncbi:MAG: sulfoxide reductase heme-binding subunit YedZ [Anaerolineae bacterium]|jgi:sulfoxide reductase heme-binding subunit YedZ